MGKLFRNKHFETSFATFEEVTKDASISRAEFDSYANGIPGDPISLAIHERLKDFLNPQTKEDAFDDFKLTQFYTQELDYIRKVHALTPGTQLLEEELVLGTIVANHGDKSFRKTKKYKMRLHSGNLVTSVQRQLIADTATATEPELCNGLTRAWRIWSVCAKRDLQFGASSLGLIALGTMLDCVERLAPGCT